MADKFTGLSNICVNLTVEVVEWRDRWQSVEPSRYNTQMKAGILIRGCLE